MLLDAKNRRIDWEQHPGECRILQAAGPELVISASKELENVAVVGSLTVTSATVLNGTIGLGNAAADTVTVTGQVAGNVEFTGAATHQIIGENNQNLQLTAAGTGDIVLATSGAATAVTVDDVAGLVTLSGALTVGGATLLNGDVTLGNAAGDTVTVTGQVAGNVEFTGAAAHQIIGETNQNLQLTAAGTGDIVLATSGAATAVTVDDVAGLVTLTGALTVGGAALLNGDVTLGNAAADTITVTGQVAGNVEFVGAATHQIIGEVDQNLQLTAAGTGDVVIATAGAASAVTVDDVAGLVTLTGGLTVGGATLLNGAVTLGDAAGDVVTVTGQVAGNIEFGGATSHQIIGETDQALQLVAVGTGSITLGTAGAASALVVSNTGGNVSTAGSVTVAADIVKTDPGGGSLKISVAEATATMTGASVTLTGLIPAKSMLVGITAVVITEITGGTTYTTWRLGVAGTTNLWGTALANAAATNVEQDDWDAAFLPMTRYDTATDVVLTPTAGAFVAGSVKVKAYYIKLTPPTT